MHLSSCSSLGSFNKVNNRNSRFRNPEIIFRIAFQYGSASGARIFIIIQMCPTNTQHGFHAPPVTQQPLITIRKSGSIQITLIPMILHILAQELQTSNIVIRIVRMQSEEMSIELLAQPITSFWLYQQCFIRASSPNFHPL